MSVANVELLKFWQLANFLERLKQIETKKEKKELIHRLWTLVGKHEGHNMFPLMRLLLPQLDISRNSYGMKEKFMMQLYVKCIPLARTSPDAMKLLKFKNPRFAGPHAGNFPECLGSVMSKRSPPKSSATIRDINVSLNELAKCHNRHGRERWCQSILNVYSALEQKWICRIILKDLNIGFRQESLLKEFHPNAQDTMHKTSSLEKVCEVATKPPTPIGSTAIQLFKPISPMLASRKNIENIIKSMNGKKFGVEIKFDGERVQLHYRRGKKFMMFSRRGLDLQDKYGYAEAFQDIVGDNMLCESCILDGEMMAWNTATETFVPFGGNRAAAASGISGDGDTHLCYMVFDCLMKDNVCTMAHHLHNRRKLAASCFRQKKNYLELVKIWEGFETTESILNILETILAQRHEGIIIKCINAKYEPAKRDFRWLKLKPDYVDDLAFHMDVLILGGYFGEGTRRTGNISHFLLGVCEKPPHGGMPKEYYTFCKVGTGYKLTELKTLQEKLKPHLRVYDKNNPPEHMKGWDPKGDDVPDAWIPPEHSVIMEIKGGEIVPCVGLKFMTRQTVRFPRCKRIRYDKPWYECMSLDDMHRIQAENVNKTKKRKRKNEDIVAIIADEKSPVKKRQRLKKVGELIHKFLPAPVKDVKEKSKLFEGAEFCILQASIGGDKTDIERRIVEYGGSFTQNPLHTTKYIIADESTFRVQTHAQFRDILKTCWIKDCIVEKKIIRYAPRHLLHATEFTRVKLDTEFDCFGDHFVDPVTPESLGEILKAIDSKHVENFLDDNSVTTFLPPHKFFHNYLFYVDRFHLETGEPIIGNDLILIEHQIMAHGGSISKKIDYGVTHVIVYKIKEKQERMKKIYEIIRELMSPESKQQWRPYVVTQDWVIDSIKNENKLEETEYSP